MFSPDKTDHDCHGEKDDEKKRGRVRTGSSIIHRTTRQPASHQGTFAPGLAGKVSGYCFANGWDGQVEKTRPFSQPRMDSWLPKVEAIQPPSPSSIGQDNLHRIKDGCVGAQLVSSPHHSASSPTHLRGRRCKIGTLLQQQEKPKRDKSLLVQTPTCRQLLRVPWRNAKQSKAASGSVGGCWTRKWMPRCPSS